MAKKTKKRRSKFGFSGFIALLVSVLLGSGIGFFTTKVPAIIEQRNVQNARIANSFDMDTYIGWAYAYNVIGRESQILYNKNPHDDAAKYFVENLDYPDKYLPDLLTDYGIAVQKPYTSNYIFTQQKNDLISFCNTESASINEARGEFLPLNDSVNANDALVIEALKYYAILVDKINSSVSTLTLKDSQNTAIGKYIKKDVGQKTFAQPLEYTNLALEYLATNLTTYHPAYLQFRKKNSTYNNIDLNDLDKIVNSVPGNG